MESVLITDLRIQGAKILKTSANKKLRYKMRLYDNGIIICGCVAQKHNRFNGRCDGAAFADDFSDDELNEVKKEVSKLSKYYESIKNG